MRFSLFTVGYPMDSRFYCTKLGTMKIQRKLSPVHTVDSRQNRRQIGICPTSVVNAFGTGVAAVAGKSRCRRTQWTDGRTDGRTKVSGSAVETYCIIALWMKNKIVLKSSYLYMKFVSEIFKLTWNYVRDRICLSNHCEIFEFIP